MQIFVNIPQRKTIALEVDPDETIFQVKIKLQEILSLPHNQQLLRFVGVRLNNNQTLANYGIFNGYIIYLYYINNTNLG